MDMTDLDVAGEVTGLIVAASIVVLTNNPYAISTNASVIQLSTSVYSGSIDSDRRRTKHRRTCTHFERRVRYFAAGIQAARRRPSCSKSYAPQAMGSEAEKSKVGNCPQT